MKSTLKWIVIIISIIIFLYAFSSSYYSQNIDHLDYVIALGIDVLPDSENLCVTFEFANLGSFSENASSEQTEPIINTIIAPTLSNAITVMNAYIGKQLNLSHCKVIVFSKDYAQTGILDEVSFLAHNIQIRPTTNIVVSECEAVTYLKKSTSSLEQVLTKYYDIFPTSSEYTGYTSNIPLGRFYENLLDKNSGAVTILGSLVENATSTNNSNKESSNNSNNQTNSSELNTSSTSSEKNDISSNKSNTTETNKVIKDTRSNSSDYQSFDPTQIIQEGDKGVENMGLAVFKDDKYVGSLSTIETLCYSLLKDEVDNFVLTIPNPFDNTQKIDIMVGDLSESKTNIDISKEFLVINIKFNLTAEVINVLNNSPQNYENTLKEVDTALKDYLTKEFKSYLYKTSKEYKSDINEFYRIAKRKFLTNSDYDNYNWSKKYENAEFNIEFNDSIISTLIIR